MIKKITLFSVLIIPAFAFMDVLSNGAPAESTGAPSEPNCTKSGCHQDFVVNSGTGTPDLVITGAPSAYIPGQTYDLIASISQSGIHTFGFQVLALADRDSSNAGTWVVTEGSRTQIISGFGNLVNRQYMTYTFPGTAETASGYDQWSFKWTAPTGDAGPISFYLAAIAANGDGTDMGDHCYLKKRNLVSSPAGIAQHAAESDIHIFPNPVAEQATVTYTLEKECTVSMDLFNMQGEKIASWYEGKQGSGKYAKTITPESSIPSGTYILQIHKDQQLCAKRIVIIR